MRRLPLVLIGVAVLSACGSSGSSGTATETTVTAKPFSSPSYEKAGPNPSKAAKMVCEPEVRGDLVATLGIKETRVTPPKWVEADHLYSCTYVYPRGRITLSVKELVSADATRAYFNGIRGKYGGKTRLIGLGQDAWILKNDDAVVRKDYKVLVVNVQGLPASFVPAMSRSDVARNIAVTIMGCWVET